MVIQKIENWTEKAFIVIQLLDNAVTMKYKTLLYANKINEQNFLKSLWEVVQDFYFWR